MDDRLQEPLTAFMCNYWVSNKELEVDISLDEVQVAIGQLQGGKTPGADGLLTEFYSWYVELLAPKLTALFSGSTTLVSLPECLEETIIVFGSQAQKGPAEVCFLQTYFFIKC